MNACLFSIKNIFLIVFSIQNALHGKNAKAIEYAIVRKHRVEKTPEQTWFLCWWFIGPDILKNWVLSKINILFKITRNRWLILVSSSFHQLTNEKRIWLPQYRTLKKWFYLDTFHLSPMMLHPRCCWIGYRQQFYRFGRSVVLGLPAYALYLFTSLATQLTIKSKFKLESIFGWLNDPSQLNW